MSLWWERCFLLPHGRTNIIHFHLRFFLIKLSCALYAIWSKGFEHKISRSNVYDKTQMFLARLWSDLFAFEPLMIRRSCAWSRLRSDPVALKAVYDHTQPQLKPVLTELKSACALELPCNFDRETVSCQLELILSVQFCARQCIQQIIIYFQHMNAPSSSWPSYWQKELSAIDCYGTTS